MQNKTVNHQITHKDNNKLTTKLLNHNEIQQKALIGNLHQNIFYIEIAQYNSLNKATSHAFYKQPQTNFKQKKNKLHIIVWNQDAQITPKGSKKLAKNSVDSP